MNLMNVYIRVFQQICYYFLKPSPPQKKKILPTPPSQIPTKCMLVHLAITHRSFKLCSLFLGLFCCSSNSVISRVLSSTSLILLPTQICLSITLVNFHFSYCSLQIQNFLLVFYLFTDIPILFLHLFLLFPHLILFL